MHFPLAKLTLWSRDYIVPLVFLDSTFKTEFLCLEQFPCGRLPLYHEWAQGQPGQQIKIYQTVFKEKKSRKKQFIILSVFD